MTKLYYKRHLCAGALAALSMVALAVSPSGAGDEVVRPLVVAQMNGQVGMSGAVAGAGQKPQTCARWVYEPSGEAHMNGPSGSVKMFSYNSDGTNVSSNLWVCAQWVDAAPGAAVVSNPPDFSNMPWMAGMAGMFGMNPMRDMAVMTGMLDANLQRMMAGMAGMSGMAGMAGMAGASAPPGSINMSGMLPPWVCTRWAYEPAGEVKRSGPNSYFKMFSYSSDGTNVSSNLWVCTQWTNAPIGRGGNPLRPSGMLGFFDAPGAARLTSTAMMLTHRS